MEIQTMRSASDSELSEIILQDLWVYLNAQETYEFVKSRVNQIPIILEFSGTQIVFKSFDDVIHFKGLLNERYGLLT